MDISPTQSILVGGTLAFPDSVVSLQAINVGAEKITLGGGAGNAVTLGGNATGSNTIVGNLGGWLN